MKIHPDCLRYERLLNLAELEILSQEDLDFIDRHHTECTGIHSDDAVEKMNWLPQGSFAAWNGRDPLPARSPEALRKMGRKLTELLDEEKKRDLPTIHKMKSVNAPYVITLQPTVPKEIALASRRDFFLACFGGAAAIAAADPKHAENPAASTFSTRDMVVSKEEIAALNMI